MKRKCINKYKQFKKYRNAKMALLDEKNQQFLCVIPSCNFFLVLLKKKLKKRYKNNEEILKIKLGDP